MRQHLERRAEDLARAGLSTEEAVRRARIEFGRLETYKAEVRAIVGPPRPIATMFQVGRDLRHAARRLRRAPAFTTFAVVSMAIGLGVATAFYAFMHVVLWPTSGLTDPSQLVQLSGRSAVDGGTVVYGGYASISRGDFERFRVAQTTMASVGAWTTFSQPFAVGDVAERLIGEAVSGSTFEMLGTRMAFGRAINPDDERENAAPVIVLAYAFWKRHFHGDPGIVGQVARLGQLDCRIIGVADKAFSTAGRPGFEGPMGWVPLELLRRLHGFSGPAGLYGQAGLTVYGRLAPGRTIEQANAEVRAISANLDRAFPQTSGGKPVPRDWWLVPSVDWFRSFAAQAWSLVALVGLVLAVACTNLANLVLARGSAHQQEIAVRRALGASRWQLVRELCAESVWLALAAGALALGITRGLLVAVLERVPPGQRFNVSAELTPDVLAAAGTALVVSVAVFGLWPALQLTRQDVRTGLVADAGTGGAIRWRTRQWLIVAQVAIAATFVTVAVTCVRAALTTAITKAGPIDLDHLATTRLSFTGTGWSEARSQVAVRQLMTLLRADPRVEAWAITTGVPISTTWPTQVARADAPSFAAHDPRATVGLISSTPELFSVLGLPVIRGRAFAEHDTAATGPVALISETTANEIFGSADPLGRVLLYRTSQPGQGSPETTSVTVIGVVADAVFDSRDNRRRSLYVPLSQRFMPNVTILARTGGDPATLLGPLRTMIRQADPALVAEKSQTATLAYHSTRWSLQLLGGLGSALGGVALALAMAGLFGVLSHLVSRRTREMGVRLALGASAHQLRRMVLSDGVRPVMFGLAIGCPVGLLVRLAFEPLSRLPASPLDAIAVGFVVVSFVVAGVAACYLPARRASSLAPSVALRDL